MSKLSLCLLIMLSIALSTEASSSGTLNHQETCDPRPSQTDEFKKCDTSKRLSCNPSTLLCECHHEGRDIFDEDSGRCETKVGKYCEADALFPSICVNNAVCNEETKFCECDEGFVMDPEKDECSGGINTESNIFMSSFLLFMLLISVFVCT